MLLKSTALRTENWRTLRHPWAFVVVGTLLVFASGCRSLDRFRLESNQTYCGSMVSAPVFQEGLLPLPSATSPPTLKLRLDLNVDGLTSRPGPLTTDDATTDHVGLCAPAPLFDRAPLRAIPEVMHDAISSMQFGDGRDLNFFAWADSTCQGTMLS